MKGLKKYKFKENFQKLKELKKYKYNKKDYQKWNDMIYIFPSVVIVLDNTIYPKKNFAIELHFLVWHCRFLFMKGGAK